MINLFCALPCEAKSIIHHYNLKYHPGSYLYSTYINKEHSISLTTTGIGKQCTAGGVIHAFMLLSSSKTDGWINIGIAGHSTLQSGTPILATKIIDYATGRNWYPQIVFNNEILTKTIITLDKPSPDYQEDNVFDMEASAFIEIANKTGSIELSHSLKIISDNESYSYKNISKAYVEKLIKKNLPVIDELVTNITLLTKMIQKPPELDDVFTDIICIKHFTHNEQLRLKTLLRRWKTLLPESKPNMNDIQKLISSKSILDHLDELLNNAIINFEDLN